MDGKYKEQRALIEYAAIFIKLPREIAKLAIYQKCNKDPEHVSVG